MTLQRTTGNDLGLRVLVRVDGELDPAAIDAIMPYEGDEPYFPDYVDANLPRDWETTDSIVAAARGYAIADESGEIIARFEGDREVSVNGKATILTALQRAERARAGAKVSLALDLPVDETASTEAGEAGTSPKEGE